MEIARMLWLLMQGFLIVAGLMAFIIFGRWEYCLSKLIKEHEMNREK